MDSFARALKCAARIKEEGVFAKHIQVISIGNRLKTNLAKKHFLFIALQLEREGKKEEVCGSIENKSRENAYVRYTINIILTQAKSTPKENLMQMTILS